MTVLAATSVVLAVLVWRPPWEWVRLRVEVAAVPRPGRRTAALTLILAVAGSLALLPLPGVVTSWTALGIAATAWRRVVRARHRRANAAVRDEAYAIIDALVTEVRSGAPAATVLDRLAPESDLLTAAAAAATSGGDVAAALVATGELPGADPMVELGRAWAVSAACGAPLVTVLEHVRESARAERELHRELAAGVAPARATATLVAAMPPLGLALGTGLGVDPLEVVLTTVPGALCVAAGVGFAIAGVLWIDLVADRVEADA